MNCNGRTILTKEVFIHGNFKYHKEFCHFRQGTGGDVHQCIEEFCQETVLCVLRPVNVEFIETEDETARIYEVHGKEAKEN